MLSNRLKQLRHENNLLQKEVAQKLKITTSAYGFYEQGKRTPDADTLNKIADYFNVSVDYLLGRTNDKTAPIPKEDTPEEKISKLVKENKIKTLAAHFDGEDITDDDVEDIKNFIEFVVQKRKKKNK